MLKYVYLAAMYEHVTEDAYIHSKNVREFRKYLEARNVKNYRLFVDNYIKLLYILKMSDWVDEISRAFREYNPSDIQIFECFDECLYVNYRKEINYVADNRNTFNKNIFNNDIKDIKIN